MGPGPPVSVGGVWTNRLTAFVAGLLPPSVALTLKFQVEPWPVWNPASESVPSVADTASPAGTWPLSEYCSGAAPPMALTCCE